MMCIEARGAGPLPHPAAHRIYWMGGRVGERAGTASARAENAS